MKVRKIKYQFFLLAAIVAFILVVVSGVGYYTSYHNLETSIGSELTATVGEQTMQVDAWVQEKVGPALGASIMFSDAGANLEPQRIETILRMSARDKDILGLTYADDTGLAYTVSGAREAGYDPRTRPWYQLGKQAGHLAFTGVYKDTRTGNPTLSAVVPFTWPNGTFRGVVCDDISLQALNDITEKLNWHGYGSGAVIEPSGRIIASSEADLRMKTVDDTKNIKGHLDEMKANGHGFFEAEGQELLLVAYQTVPVTGWIVVIGVPKADVYAPLAHLRITYIIFTLLGLALMLFFSWRFEKNMTSRIGTLRQLAEAMADGNLHVQNAEDLSPDELGDLSRAFNKMKMHLRDLVQKIVQAAGDISASSEELTATTEQTAEAANASAQSVSEVASGVSQETEDMHHASDDVKRIYQRIEAFAQTSTKIAQSSEQAKEAAKQGSSLMAHALQNMDGIDSVTQHTAEVIARLGESQSQIGEIVNTIVSIADQTNLLALNAAIEAARAGDQGRGFAVVADEVRKLAGESSKSAEEIRKRIAKIQKDTQEAVDTMATGKDSIAQGTGAIRDVDVQFSGILKKVEGIYSQMADVKQTADDLAQTTQGVVHSIERVEHIAQETAGHAQSISAATEEQNASTEEIAAAARGLAQMAENLQAATSHFKI